MKYVILGASAAGINAAKKIRELDNTGEITLISSDDKVYSRCMLHHIIDKKRTIEEMSFIEKDFFANRNIHWIKGRTAEEIDINNKKVLLDDKTSQNYDKLLIATGAEAHMPPIKNIHKAKNVFNFRDVEHAEQINNNLNNVKTAVIIGAGLVGMDAAAGLIERGIKVSIIEASKRILPLQLDEQAAANYEKLLNKNNAEVFTGKFVKEVVTDDKGFANHVLLSDGSTVKCEIVIVAVGVKPNIGFIKDERIKIENGILIDETCKTSVEDVYAAGDVCGRSAIWSTAVKQAITAAYNMTGNEKTMEDYFTAKNSMSFFGLVTISVGMIEPPDNSYQVEIFENRKNYKKIIHKDGILYGAIFQGDITYCGIFTEFIKKKVDISSIKKRMFDLNYADFYSMQTI